MKNIVTARDDLCLKLSRDLATSKWKVEFWRRRGAWIPHPPQYLDTYQEAMRTYLRWVRRFIRMQRRAR